MAVTSFIPLTRAAINYSSPQVTLHVSPPIQDESFITLELKKEKATNIPPQFYISEAWTVSQMFTASQGVDIDKAEITGSPFDADSTLCKFYGNKNASSEEISEHAFTIGDIVNATAATGIYCQALYFDFPPEYNAVHENAVGGRN